MELISPAQVRTGITTTRVPLKLSARIPEIMMVTAKSTLRITGVSIQAPAPTTRILITKVQMFLSPNVAMESITMQTHISMALIPLVEEKGRYTTMRDFP